MQRRELDFWNRWTTRPAFRNLDIPSYWRREITHFGKTWDCFAGLRVLDVGCGPFGLIHFIDHAAERIRIDPLLPSYEQKLPVNGTHLSVSAVAESLPLPDRCVDLIICFNALDHMRDPETALSEIDRVLRAGGTALVMIHTYPHWLRPLYWVDRMHPHHYTARSFEFLLKSHFEIEQYKTLRRHFDVPPGKWWHPAVWKYVAGGLVVSSTYVRARKR